MQRIFLQRKDRRSTHYRNPIGRLIWLLPRDPPLLPPVEVVIVRVMVGIRMRNCPSGMVNRSYRIRNLERCESPKAAPILRSRVFVPPLAIAYRCVPSTSYTLPGVLAGGGGSNRCESSPVHYLLYINQTGPSQNPKLKAASVETSRIRGELNWNKGRVRAMDVAPNGYGARAKKKRAGQTQEGKNKERKEREYRE